MKRRALTLIEMLVALVLLSSVVIASSSWVQLSSSAGADQLKAARWSSTADAVLQLIHDDVACGDFEPGKPSEQRKVRCEIVDSGVLAITTRESGANAVHRYRFDVMTGTLDLLTSGHVANATGGTPQLLTQVDSFEAQISDDESRLLVKIVSKAGERRQGSYRLPS